MTVRLQTDPFDPGSLLSAFSANRDITGAVVTFTGIARGEAGEVTTLELEAYPGFTDVEIERFATAARDRFSLHDLLIVHRTGAIAPGEAIVFVATAAAHRREAFEAANHLMDYLKSRAPFWKKEITPDGAAWVDARVADDEALRRWGLEAGNAEH